MIVDIKKIIENKKDREFYLECFNSGVSFEEICNIHNKTIEYKNLLRNENIRAQNFFKSGDTDKESFLNFFNTVEKTIRLEPYKEKWESFNWEVRRVDGHNIRSIVEELKRPPSSNKPICLICDTTKGKGISFMEDSVLWHYRPPNKEEYEAAIKELEK